MSDNAIAHPPMQQSAALDDAHIGDINGALGTILVGDHGPRHGWRARLLTLLAILGPGLIVMVGDNDAGAFGTYTQAGQNYGTSLLWTLMLLIPVLYVNQEMVLRLGAVTGIGHAHWRIGAAAVVMKGNCKVVMVRRINRNLLSECSCDCLLDFTPRRKHRVPVNATISGLEEPQI